MERESFENEEIAQVMNENFVNIKVDREERPDVDKVYMTFVQVHLTNILHIKMFFSSKCFLLFKHNIFGLQLISQFPMYYVRYILTTKKKVFS